MTNEIILLDEKWLPDILDYFYLVVGWLKIRQYYKDVEKFKCHPLKRHNKWKNIIG